MKYDIRDKINNMVLREQTRQLNHFQFNALTIILLAVLIAASLLLRFSLAEFKSGDFNIFLHGWYSHIKNDGHWTTLAKQFSQYNPPYLYLLTLFSYLPYKDLYVIKLVSTVFDYVAAFWVYQLVKQRYNSMFLAWLGFLAVTFTPTVVLNSSLWAQCDSIYSSFLLGSLFFMMQLTKTPANNHRLVLKYSLLSIVFFTLAFSFKLQAIFFILPLLFLLAKGKIPWYLWLVMPVLYLLVLLPNNLLGAPWIDLLSIYTKQVDLHPNLTSGAPTAYAFLPGAPIKIAGRAGVIFASAIIVFFAWLLSVIRVNFTREAVMRIALLSVLLVPYFLPRMHERYFYAADLISIVFAFYFPRRWFIPLGIIGISLFSYRAFLFGVPSSFTLETLALAMGVIIIILVRDLVRYHLLNQTLIKDA